MIKKLTKKEVQGLDKALVYHIASNKEHNELYGKHRAEYGTIFRINTTYAFR